MSLCSAHSCCVRVISVRFCSFEVLFQISVVFDNFGYESNVSFCVRATKLLAYSFCVERICNPVTSDCLRTPPFKLFGYVCRGFPAYAKVTEEMLLSL